MKNIVIETYKDGNEAEINSLFNGIFNRNRDLNEWKWKFLECPVDARPFIFLAKDRGRIVGHAASLIYSLKYFNTIKKIHNTIDFMVHPDYRGGYKGIPVQIYQAAYIEWIRNDIDCAFAYPNREGYIVVKKLLKYKDFINVRIYFKRLSWRTAAAKRSDIAYLVNTVDTISRFIILLFIRSIPNRFLKDVRYSWVTSLDESKINAFWQDIKNNYDIWIQRDYKYLNWRYIRKPNSDYHVLKATREDTIVGMAIVNISDSDGLRVGYVMDCFAKEDCQCKELLRKCLIFLSKKQAAYVLCKISSGDPFQEVLDDLGFAREESNYNYSVYQTYGQDASGPSFNDASKWHISFGDGDDH
jgi:hypothetical protein